MIKIIYVSNANLPSLRANAVHVMRMCDAFAENGVDISLYCDEKGDLANTYELYGVKHCFSIISPQKNSILIKKRSGFVNSLVCSWKNANTIKRGAKETFVYGRSLPILFFLNNRFSFSYEVHAIPTNRITKWMERCVLKNSKLVSLVAISQPLKEYYEKAFPEELKGKTIVLHDGADMVDKTTAKKAVIDNAKSRFPDVAIGYVGSLYPGKCMEVLLPVAKAMPGVLFHIVGGDKEWVKHWQDEANKNEVKNLVFYGKIAPAKVSEYYEALDICLMPYSSKIYVDKDKKLEIGQWISPLKLFEAMAHEKAIVVTDLPSIREVMNDGKDALLLNAHETDKWVEAIEKLAESLELRKQLSSNARKKLEEEYSWVVRTQKIIKKVNLQ